MNGQKMKTVPPNLNGAAMSLFLACERLIEEHDELQRLGEGEFTSVEWAKKAVRQAWGLEHD